MARIIFADGTEITATQNGDCYILPRKIPLPDDLSIVTVQGNDGTVVYRNAELLECASVDGEYWFAFTEISAEELDLRKMKSNIQIIADMTDIDLDSAYPEREISLKERINDLEVAICELVDALA